MDFKSSKTVIGETDSFLAANRNQITTVHTKGYVHFPNYVAIILVFHGWFANIIHVYFHATGDIKQLSVS